MTMPFGKYKGCPVADLDSGYLEWLVSADILYDSRLRDEVEAEHARRTSRTQVRPAGTTITIERAHIPVVRQLVDAGFRVLAKQHHPDVGGDTVAMQRLNAAVAAIRPQLAALECTR
jgi:hypothetical protein